MPIPAEILAVERPKNTRVKKSGERYLVIKRTCRYVNGRNVPVELGTVGEIVNGAYVEKRKESRPKGTDIKDYGEVALCDMCGKDLLRELADVWNMADSKRLYVMALLRAAYSGTNARSAAATSPMTPRNFATSARQSGGNSGATSRKSAE